MYDQRTRTQLDSYYMQQALELAEQALAHDEVPIGALVVDHVCDKIAGAIIGCGYNQTEYCKSQSRHAEVIAIEQAGQQRQDWRLDGCTLYVTLQPCLMCISLVGLSRIERVVYGAKSPLFGYDLDKELLPDLYKRQIKGVTSAVEAEQAEALLKKFFKTKRTHHE
jgi:tRNA(adenine34) deaminase